MGAKPLERSEGKIGGEFEAGALLGALSRSVPLEAIGKAVDAAGKRERRTRRLPSELTVQLVLALALVSDAASRQVLAYLLPEDAVLPTKKSVSRARYRVGPRPMMELLELLAAADPEPDPAEDAWAFYKNMRLFSLDATCLETPDTRENLGVFGRNGSAKGKARAAFPQAHVAAWLDNGPRLVRDLAVRPRRRREGQMGRWLLKRQAGPGQLILWDRGFQNWRELGNLATSRGAHFLARIKGEDSVAKKIERILPDGTYLARVEAPPGSSGGGEAIVARIIEYKVGQKGQKIRLATSLIDWREHAAEDLALVYRERWEIENVFDELKTHLRGRPNGQTTMVRAQKPAGVIQEIYGQVLAHRAIRLLMAAAAKRHGGNIDPDRLSFKNALVILRRRLNEIKTLERPDQLPPFWTPC
jgi:hypothetical protein